MSEARRNRARVLTPQVRVCASRRLSVYEKRSCTTMPPYSKPYPITKSLSNTSKNQPLLFRKPSSLAIYQKQPANSYLKSVVRHLKEPLGLFHKIVVKLRLSVTIQSDYRIEHYQWELTIKEARRNLDCDLDALGVLQQGLFHSKALLSLVKQIVDDEKSFDNFGEEELEKLKKLKEILLNLNKFLDCVLLHYSSFSCALPRIEEIKRAAKKIHKTINNLKPDKLHNLIPESTVTVTEEDVLCSVLGLQDDFAHRLRNLSEEMRNHKTDMYFLLCFMKERNDALNLERFSDKAAAERDLQKLGFTENRSNIIANWIFEQPFPEHKSLLAWAEIYIENLFKYDIFLNDLVPEFPYEGQCLNKWFNVKVERDNDDNVSVFPVQVANTTTEKGAIARIQEKITEINASNAEGRVYFHGTDHDGAKSILEDGIKLREGKRCCDFSNGEGFFLADDFNIALQYAQKSKASAVILFNISKDSLKNGLDLSPSERRDDLKSVTSFFRKGEHRRNRPEKKLYNEVNNCNYINGPISRDGRRDEDTKWKNVQQMCIKKQEMAEEIGNPSRMCIVFLNTKDHE